MTTIEEARAALDRGEKVAALNALAEAERNAPRTCRDLAAIAHLLRKAGDMPSAERVFLAALSQPTDEASHDAFVALGQLRLERSQPLDAAFLFKQARRLAAGGEQAISDATSAIEASMAANDHEGAIEELIFLARQPGLDAAAIRRTLSRLYAMQFHKSYYDSRVWTRTTWRGVNVLKLPFDTWNYQEILFSLKPRLVVEFGTCCGGSALYFADLLQLLWSDGNCRVLTVDVSLDPVSPLTRQHPKIEVMTCSSLDPRVLERIAALRQQYPGPIFTILDSNHEKSHVLAEMIALRGTMRRGDYLIVEDGDINGHPVRPDFGPGPFEAIGEYLRAYPDDYERDEARETRFGITAAPNGYLIRR